MNLVELFSFVFPDFACKSFELKDFWPLSPRISLIPLAEGVGVHEPSLLFSIQAAGRNAHETTRAAAMMSHADESFFPSTWACRGKWNGRELRFSTGIFKEPVAER